MRLRFFPPVLVPMRARRDVMRAIWRGLGLCAILLAGALAAQAQQTVPEKALPLNGTWSEAGTAFTLDWQDAKPLRVGPVDINRRPLGATGGASWEPVVQNLQNRFFFTDRTITPGRAYEYQVIRRARDIVDVGYWLTGWEVETSPERGIALLVIDETIAEPLGAYIDRFARDLIGDGWQVVRHLAPRHRADAPQDTLTEGRALRRWITREAERNGDVPHSLILLGHVPVMRSGQVAPDGHGRVAHATDLFYADIGRRWSSTEDGLLRPSTLPDLRIDMRVGRIDFAPLARGDTGRELQLLAQYLTRNHHWRHGRFGPLPTAYGQHGMLAVERTALRNIVGPQNVVAGGHEDAGRSGAHLWGVDFGKRPKHQGELALHTPPIQPVFAINFGSHKQKFERRNNAMVALLAQGWHTLAVGWGGRPAWQLQHMALGGTIGDVHFRTVNNGPLTGGPYRQVLDYFPMGQYLWRGPIWVNLMGDPTLHAFPAPAPQLLRAERDGGSVHLSWAVPDTPSRAPEDAGTVWAEQRGVQVFRATDQEGPFTAISPVLNIGRFTDADAPDGAVYMLRAYRLQHAYAGAFFAYGQGRFVMPYGDLEPPAQVVERLQTNAGEALVLPQLPGALGGYVNSPPEGAGHLGQDPRGVWVYTPPPGFTGEVILRNAVSNAAGTTEGQTVIEVLP